MEWLTLLAVLLGPFLGIWAYGMIEERKRAYQRRLDIFKTLMATRAVPLSSEHVEALNRIDIEFTARNAKKVRDAWASLLDNFGQGPRPPDKPAPGANEAAQNAYAEAFRQHQAALDRWVERSIDLRATLLKEMGTLFKYDFDEVKIKRAAYRPKLHDDLEAERHFALLAMNEVLSGSRPLSMSVTNWPSELSDEQKEMFQQFARALDEDGAYRVKLVDQQPPAR